MEDRLSARGKFLFEGHQKFFVKGISYGAFQPDSEGREYHNQDQIQRDFSMMAEAGANVVRIPHTMPPPHLLDIAQRWNLRVMVGLSAEQYVGYLIDRKGAPNIEEIVRRKVRACAGHPALLCYSLGNEISPSLARWLGPRRIEDYLRKLYQAVKEEDPDSLVTYVNYPTTEYLHLPFLDLVCFNVYLEDSGRLAAYQARLHNLAGDRPLIMSELGLDALRNGEHRQAAVLEEQIRVSFEQGCAGAIVFSWTDEWFRGGSSVSDWAFGLTDAQRRPKPAYYAVQRAFKALPVTLPSAAPKISVIVCTYNGARTIAETLHHLERLHYPDYEVIVVDDGSTDATAEIAARFNVRLIRTPNRGLSAARNTGMQAAAGEILAYIDDDAYPDPDWLAYLAAMFQRTDHAAVGGPNIAPPEDPAIAQCVARAPGGPSHVLLTDGTAEHIPGCNFAIRKSCLVEIGGFDPAFRVAGDDVDLCWRLQARGWTIGFAPAAVVWHHRRASVTAYWRQQRSYGHAEALLENKWPQKFNEANHISWSGRVYTAGLHLRPGRRNVIYYGLWGQAPFQSLYGRAEGFWSHLPFMPEWHLVNFSLLILSLSGLFWRPMLAFAALLLFSLALPAIRTYANLGNARFPASSSSSGRPPVRLRLLTLWLSILQPIARFQGRFAGGLAPWRTRGLTWRMLPRRKQLAFWTEAWVDPARRLARMEASLQELGLSVHRGGPFDPWDLEVRGGILGAARVLMAAEDHGSGAQYVRVRIWPRFSWPVISLTAAGLLLTALAALDGKVIFAAALGAVSLLPLFRWVQETGCAIFGAETAAGRQVEQAK
jgi:GT2 family glycosyltransferase